MCLLVKSLVLAVGFLELVELYAMCLLAKKPCISSRSSSASGIRRDVFTSVEALQEQQEEPEQEAHPHVQQTDQTHLT